MESYLVNKFADFEKKSYYSIREVREIVTRYIMENELDKDVKRGFYKLDPYLVKIAG